MTWLQVFQEAQPLLSGLAGGLVSALLVLVLQVKWQRDDERTKLLRDAYANWAFHSWAMARAVLVGARFSAGIPEANRDYNRAVRTHLDALGQNKPGETQSGWERRVERLDKAADGLEQDYFEAGKRTDSERLLVKEARFRVLMLEKDTDTRKRIEAASTFPKIDSSMEKEETALQFAKTVESQIEDFLNWYASRH